MRPGPRLTPAAASMARDSRHRGPDLTRAAPDMPEARADSHDPLARQGLPARSTAALTQTWAQGADTEWTLTQGIQDKARADSGRRAATANHLRDRPPCRNHSRASSCGPNLGSGSDSNLTQPGRRGAGHRLVVTLAAARVPVSVPRCQADRPSSCQPVPSGPVSAPSGASS